MFNWLFGNRLFRGAANRSAQKLAAQFGPGPATAILALSLAYSCYPNATYGDRALHDDIVAKLSRLGRKPCDQKSACKFVEQWLDAGVISTQTLFTSIWQMGPDELVQAFAESPE